MEEAPGSPAGPARSGGTTLSFVTLPLTPPGKPSSFSEDASSAATSPASPFAFIPKGPSAYYKFHPPALPLSPLGSSSHLQGEKNGSMTSTPRDPPLAFSRHPSFEYVSDKLKSRILSPLPSLARKPSFLSKGSSFVSRDIGAQHPFDRVLSNGTGEVLEPSLGGYDWRKEDIFSGKSSGRARKESGLMDVKAEGVWRGLRRILRPGNRPSKRLIVLIGLNFAYSTIELLIGLITGRIGLVSDAFHLTFGCGVLTFSLYAMMVADKPPDKAYTYGYKRLEVLAAFTNTLFLLFLSFSLGVEALHAFVQDESEHKHYLIVSAVANLLVNLLGVWFFRGYARVNVELVKAGAVAAVLGNQIAGLSVNGQACDNMWAFGCSAGVILASWLLTSGLKNAETLCLGLVSVAIFMTTMPLFQAAGAVLLQMAPSGTSASVLNKCIRQVRMDEDVVECYNARFWDMAPGSIVGTLLLQVKEGADEQRVLKHVHSIYNDIGVMDLTVEIEGQQ